MSASADQNSWIHGTGISQAPERNNSIAGERIGSCVRVYEEGWTSKMSSLRRDEYAMNLRIWPNVIVNGFWFVA